MNVRYNVREIRPNPSMIGCCLAFLALTSLPWTAKAAVDEGEAVVAAGDHRIYVANLSGKRDVRRSEPIEGIGRPVVVARSGEARLLVGCMRDRFQQTYRELVEVDLDSLSLVRPNDGWRDANGKPYSFGEIYELKTFPEARLALVSCQSCGSGMVLVDLDQRKILKSLPEVLFGDEMWLSKDQQFVLSARRSGENGAPPSVELFGLASTSRRRLAPPDWSTLEPQFGSEPKKMWADSMWMSKSGGGGIEWQSQSSGGRRFWRPRPGGGVNLDNVAIDCAKSRLLVPVRNGHDWEVVLLSFEGRELARFAVGPYPTNALLISRLPPKP